jgi:DNA-binding LacI/PurR family transcriptional regulator
VGTTDNWEFERVAYEATQHLLRTEGFPTRTILCANDRVAFGVIAAIYQAGLRIGQGPDCDFRVAGHDNQPLSAFTCPPLTTVSQDVGRMGRLALSLLLTKIGEPSEAAAEIRQTGDRILLSGELVFRTSA